MKSSQTTSIRFNASDLALLAALQRATGITRAAELVRLGLRTLATREGLPLPATAPPPVAPGHSSKVVKLDYKDREG